MSAAANIAGAMHAARTGVASPAPTPGQSHVLTLFVPRTGATLTTLVGELSASEIAERLRAFARPPMGARGCDAIALYSPRLAPVPDTPPATDVPAAVQSTRARLDVSEWRRVRGGDPVGVGPWHFRIGHDPRPFVHPGRFTSAALAAIREADRVGASVVHLCAEP